MKRWIQTWSGLKFDPLNPDPEAIRIEDIAHALANVCRFTGHTNYFYSVAEHSVYVSQRCDPADALAGLLHDATEAYMADIAAPIKQDPIFDGYRAAERRLERVILERFGLAPVLPGSVKEADARMLATEATRIMTPLHLEWELYAKPYEGMVIVGFEPVRACALFLDRFFALGGRR